MFLFGKINGSLNIEFLLDTGCSGTLLAKEVGDILFLKGNLTESDVKGTSTSYYGGLYSAEQKDVNIRSLTLGKVKLKDINASIGDRYGGTTLLGMAALDKMNGYAITKDALTIDDGKPEQTNIKTKNRIRRGLRVLSNKSARFVKKVVWRIISLTTPNI